MIENEMKKNRHKKIFERNQSDIIMYRHKKSILLPYFLRRSESLLLETQLLEDLPVI